MMQVMRDIGGVELPEALIKLQKEQPSQSDNGTGGEESTGSENQ